MDRGGSDWNLSDAKLITPEQVKTILDAAKKHAEEDPSWKRDYEWFAIAVNTGLRLSEVAHIEKDDVLEARLMMTRRKKRKLKPSPIEVMPAIHAMIHARASKVESGYIFPGNAKPCVIYRQKTDKDTKIHSTWEEQVCVGGHSSLRTIQRRWRILLTELGLYQHGRGIHSLRHSAITSVYAATHDLLKAQTFAGHSSPVMTTRYAKILDMRETLAKMPTML